MTWIDYAYTAAGYLLVGSIIAGFIWQSTKYDDVAVLAAAWLLWPLTLTFLIGAGLGKGARFIKGKLKYRST